MILNFNKKKKKTPTKLHDYYLSVNLPLNCVLVSLCSLDTAILPANIA